MEPGGQCCIHKGSPVIPILSQSHYVNIITNFMRLNLKGLFKPLIDYGLLISLEIFKTLSSTWILQYSFWIPVVHY